MAGGVAGGQPGRDAGQRLFAIRQHAHAFGNDCQPPRAPDGKAGAGVADAAHGIGVHPIVEFGLPDHVFGIGENRFVKLIQQAPEMVGVAVGEQDMGDVIRGQVQRGQRIGQLARAWAGNRGLRRHRTARYWCRRAAG